MSGYVQVHLRIFTLAAMIAGSQVYPTNVMYIPAPTLNVLKVHRATAYTLLVEVPCQPFCNVANVNFKLKQSHSTVWTQPPMEVRSHPSHNDTFNIEELQPDTIYYIRALLNPPGVYTPVLQARTCPERPPPVSNLRVAGSGPGWLDVRWTPPPKESCVSDYEYMTRYKVAGGKFSPPRTYGVVPSHDKGFIHIRPSHPCTTWPSEFCLLLVDDVQPGRNHTVAVQVHRLDGKKNERADIQSIVGFADTRPMVSNVFQEGETVKSNEKTARQNSVRTWFIVTVIGLVLLVVFTALVLVLLHSGLLVRRTESAAPSQSATQPLAPGDAADVDPSNRRRSLRLCGGYIQPWAFTPPPPYEDVAFLDPHTAPNPRTLESGR